MTVGNQGAQAVLLGDGRVLVVGGSSDFMEVGDSSVKAELWDPATGGWHRTESLNKPRGEFAAVPMLDGRALVTGGRNQTDQSYSSTYIYDPALETWTKAGLLGTARTAPAAAVLPDGRVLIAGGYFRIKPSWGHGTEPGTVLAASRPSSHLGSGLAGPRVADIDPPNVGAALATAELFDPSSGTWSATDSMTYARSGAAAVTLADGRILVVGSVGSDSGVTFDDRAVESAEIYDPVTGRFSLAGRFPDIDRKALERQGAPNANPVPDEDPWPAEGGSLVALDDGGALLIARTGWWKHVGEITRSFRFDARTLGWSEVGQTYIFIGEPTAKSLVTQEVRRLAGAMAARLPGGLILVAGGAGAIPKGSEYPAPSTAATAEAYDPTTNSWSALPSMPEPRAGAATVVLSDGSILCIGGYKDTADAQTVLTSAVRWVPSP
jgi:N-acetylneuraminic acid mutarotase